MKRSILMLGAAMLLLPLMVVGQVANENLANGIIAARKKEAAMLQQYNWNQRTEILKNGTLQDLRIDLMSCDGEGNTQRSLLNDQQGQLPGGFLRKRIAENQRKDLEKYVHDVGKLVDQYTLPSAGKVIDFLATAQVTPSTTPQGTTILQVNGSGVVVPGDTFNMTVDGRTLRVISMQISTFYNTDPVTVSATFKQMNAGPNHMQYATVEATGKDATVMIHNYDYVSQQ